MEVEGRVVLTASEASSRDHAISWLLGQENPGLRYWTFRDLFGRSVDDSEVKASQDAVASWRPVSALLTERRPEGYLPRLTALMIVGLKTVEVCEGGDG